MTDWLKSYPHRMLASSGRDSLAVSVRAIVAARRVVASACRSKDFYWVACLCLVAVAGYLRFRGLSDNSLRFDEAVAAHNSRGSLWEVLPNTRHANSSPIVYPLVLYAVQLVESSAFSVRAVPAAAGTMAVAALVFLLPRVGVARPVAFLAGVMLTVSAEAIRHAQDAREYSVDALLAVLMIVGLLRYSRDGKRVLLCAALFTAPLLQYGLVLLGIGVLGTAVVLTPPRSLCMEEVGFRRGASDNRQRVVWSWLGKRVGLLWPGACLLAGCAISWWLTLRFQRWEEGQPYVSYLGEYYFLEKYAVGPVVDFTASRTLRLLDYHLPKEIVVPVVFALIIGVLASPSCRRICFNPVIVLFLFVVAIANFAALEGAYPLGPIRQNIYLGPVIFLAAASAFHMSAYLPAQSLRKWLSPALLVAAVAAIAYVGGREFHNTRVRLPFNYVESALDVLDEQVRPGDLIYLDLSASPIARFYQRQDQENFIYEGCEWDATVEECLYYVLTQVKPETKRLWLLHIHALSIDYKLLEVVHPSISIEQHFDARRTRLWLITNPHLLKESPDRLAEVVPGMDAVLINTD